GPQRRHAARRCRLPRARGRRRVLLREARELRREQRRRDDCRRDRAHGRGAPPCPRAVRRRARGGGPVPRRRGRGGVVRMRAATATLRLLPRAALRLPALPSAITRGRLLVVTLIALALGSLYQFWFRDSSLVKVEHVTVTGLDTPDGGRVRAELTAAARRLTTLDLNEGALRRAVAAEPI